jgi:regulator of protease activity HflC (stomatin/prohibitin superfamily)
MINYVSGLVFVALGFVGLLVSFAVGRVAPPLGLLTGVVWFFADLAVASAINMAAEWERAVVFRFGKYSGVKGPGLFLIIPLIDQLRVVDTRVQAITIAHQSVITKDNIPVTIDGVLFFRVTSPEDALIKVQNYLMAVTQYAKTALRDVIGQMTLDQFLAEREKIEKAIEEAVERDTKAWGLGVTGIRIEDISLPEDLKKMMSRQASAEREKRATISKAEGDRDAAMDLAQAAETMAKSPGAMHLRTLQTLDGLGPTASNTVVIGLPLDLMEAIRAMRDSLAAKKN